MAGSAVSELIFFIAAIMISSAVAVTLIDVIDDYSSDLRDEASVLRGEMRSDMILVNDPQNVPYETGTGNITFYFKNTGTGDLSIDDLVVSANRTVGTGSNLTVQLLGGGSRWSPGKTVQANFLAGNMDEGEDYHGWATTSGLTTEEGRRGSTEISFVFRIRGV
jgi:flagellar protein FlaG